MPLQDTLPGKYNVMAKMAFDLCGADAVAVMEDDDVYFSRYLETHAISLENSSWSHCSTSWTDGSGGGPARALGLEQTGHRRLHGCLAMSKMAFDEIGGWPDTKRMDFDLSILDLLNRRSRPGDPCLFGESQYYFRWASTGEPHGQAYSCGGGDEDWLRKAREVIDEKRGLFVPDSITIEPAMDAETKKIWR
jgi:hypothetical protein